MTIIVSRFIFSMTSGPDLSPSRSVYEDILHFLLIKIYFEFLLEMNDNLILFSFLSSYLK